MYTFVVLGVSQVYSLGLTSRDDYVKLFKRIAGVTDDVSDILDMFLPSGIIIFQQPFQNSNKTLRT